MAFGGELDVGDGVSGQELPEVWIETAMHENKFDPCYGHYGTLDDMMKNHSVKAKLADGTVAKVIDAAAALRSGKKVNVVGF